MTNGTSRTVNVVDGLSGIPYFVLDHGGQIGRERGIKGRKKEKKGGVIVRMGRM